MNMEEYYEKKMNEANVQMSALREKPVENSHRGMHDAMESVVEHGTSCDIADAISMSWASSLQSRLKS